MKQLANATIVLAVAVLLLAFASLVTTWRLHDVKVQVARLSRPPVATTSPSARVTVTSKGPVVARADIHPDPILAAVAHFKSQCGHGFQLVVAVDGTVTGTCR